MLILNENKYRQIMYTHVKKFTIAHNKYKNTIVYEDNFCFRSKKERDFYLQLKALKKANKIKILKLQVAYKIPPDSRQFKRYLLDFYVKFDDDSEHFYDVKGFKTELYKLKKLLVEHFYKIKIEEV